MFHSANKIKPLAQVLRDGNSRNRFLTELTKNEDKLFNRSLDSVQTALLEKKPSNFKQTKLCVRRSLKRPYDHLNDTFTTADQMETKTELFIMPMPKMKILESKAKLNSTVCGASQTIEQPSCSTKVKKNVLNQREGREFLENKSENDPLAQPGRDMMILVGKVDFVLKTTKMYPKINVLWDVYGKLLKISKGKNRYEYVLLMRNIEEDGPILQCIYYDFNNTLEMYPNGSNIRIVGHIINGSNRLRAFKLQLLDEPIQQSNLMRIQNVNSFVLLQNQTTNT